MASDSLCKILGHDFADPALLGLALTHASHDLARNNERLEFLGDRVLGLLVADLLHHAFPTETEGDLARRHTALVQEGALADIARKLGLRETVILSDAERKSGGADKNAILADALEAVIAALYLDGGLEAARRLVNREWQPLLETYAAPPVDPKTALQEWAQARGLPLPAYSIADKSGSDHAPVFTVRVDISGHGFATATAGNKREAEKLAAQQMLEKTK